MKKDPQPGIRRRIALVYPFVNNRGGVERYLVNVGKHLSRHYDVTFLANRWDKDVTGGIRVEKVPSLSFPSFLQVFSFCVMSSFRLKRHPFSLVHTQGVSSFRQDIITAHSCHVSWFKQSRAELRPWNLRWWLKSLNPLHYLTMFVERIQYRKKNFKKVIAVSHQVKSELMKEYDIPNDCIEVIYSGVDSEEFSPALAASRKNDLMSRLGISNEDIVILFVSNEFRRKGLHVLLEAVAAVREPRLLVLVVGKDRPAPLLAYSERLGIARRVIFAGASTSIAPFFAASDMFVLPTRYEPFGLVITEAMASGLPVVVSGHAGAAELITDGLDGVLLRDETDSRELAGHIRSLLDERKRREIGNAARRTAGGLTWERTAEAVRRIYEGLLTDPA